MSDIAVYPINIAVTDQEFPLNVIESNETVALDVATSIQIVNGEKYQGSYTVTPSREAVVLNTIGKELEDNITVEPIPSNYGLITWNGSIITVS